MSLLAGARPAVGGGGAAAAAAAAAWRTQAGPSRRTASSSSSSSSWRTHRWQQKNPQQPQSQPQHPKHRGSPPPTTAMAPRGKKASKKAPNNSNKQRDSKIAAVALGPDAQMMERIQNIPGGAEALQALLGLNAQATEVASEALQAPFLDAVFKVYCIHSEPNFSLPWQRKRQYSSTGSGFAIAGRRLLTNAHCVEHHSQVKVKRRGDDTKFLARVLAVGVECDIALLTVDDDKFWENLQPLSLGTLPRLQDAVTVVGYPIGGDTISVTSGVVSRIEVMPYAHGSSELLGLQIDAAINAGNSGGPAFNDAGQCVGIAFQSLKSDDAENIGYVIPTPVINHFLMDYEKTGKYTGFPALCIEWQKLESPALRAYLGMKPGQKGVLIRRIQPTSHAASELKPGDVVMSFDGVAVANDGTVAFRSGERISFGYLVSQKYADESARLGILREGKELQVEVRLSVLSPLVPVHIHGALPSYLIVAGLVFTIACEPYLRSEYGEEFMYDAPVKILDKLLHAMPKTPDEQVVVLAQVLASDVTIGYEDINNSQLKKFNGVEVRNLRHLTELVHAFKNEKYLVFELEYDNVLVLDSTAAHDATTVVCAIHGIPSHLSQDLVDIGKAAEVNGSSANAADDELEADAAPEHGAVNKQGHDTPSNLAKCSRAVARPGSRK
eukprot:jgi/Chlat1/8717/Chrsp9S08549